MNTISHNNTQAIPEKLLSFFLLGIGYLITAQLGYFIFIKGHFSPAVIWPPAGIAMGGILVAGYWLWPAIAVASLINSLIIGIPVVFAVLIALGNAFQAFAGAYILRKLNFNVSFLRFLDVFYFMVVAAMVTTVAPTVSVGGALLLHVNRNLTITWGSRWLGEMLSVLLLTPLIARWIRGPGFPEERKEQLETLAAFLVLAGIDFILFWTPYVQIGRVPLVYALLIPLLWIALRMGFGRMTGALLMTAIIGITGIFFGYVPVSPDQVGIRLMLTEIFIVVLSGIFYVLSSISEERRSAATKLKNNVIELERALRQISSDNQAKSQFIAVLAHELRNPLAPVVSYLELLGRMDIKQPQAKTFIETIGHNVRNISRILDDLLDISRISKHTFELKKEPLAIHPVLKRSLESVAPLAREKHLRLSLYMPRKKVIVTADPVRLEQIFVNLLNNAVKYTPARGTVKVRGALKNGVICVTVADTGIGLPEDSLAKIFEPFIQLENTTAKQSGLGIGLYLTKKLVELHDGSIQARSGGIGKGSEFSITLPAAGEGTLVPPSIAPDFKKHKVAKTQVLIVDDNRAAAESLGQLLQDSGYMVKLAYDGEEALGTVTRVRPDIVILDIGLPGIDGYEVAKTMQRHLQPPATLIALTGYGQEEDKEKAARAGFSYHLTKPVSIMEVEAVLKMFTKRETGIGNRQFSID